MLPNLLIVGAQKSGTSWLHRALDQSRYFSGSRPKELNYWDRALQEDHQDYQKYFSNEQESVRFWYESTPSYFQTPKGGVDVARRIREGLGDIPLILMLRDPTERYLSAYTHHMMKGRFPKDAEISAVSNTFKMMSLGRYGEILEHFRGYFSNIHIHLLDDLKADSFKLIQDVMKNLDVPCDLELANIDFKANAKALKVSQSGWEANFIPELTADARKQLNDYFRTDVAHLSAQIGRDLSHWLQ